MRAAGHGKPYPSPIPVRQTASRDGIPDIAAVNGFVDSAIGSYRWINAPGWALVMQQCCPHGLRPVRVKNHVNSARIFISEKDFLPGCATIGGAEDTALRSRAVSAAHCCDEDHVRVM